MKFKNKNISWWSLGLDLFSGKKVSKDENMEMKGITKYLLKEYPMNNLNYSNSYSYPKLFSMNEKVFDVCFYFHERKSRPFQVNYVSH